MTILLPSERRGEQQPRVLSRPAWSSSAGEEAIDLARSAGVHLDPWQELAVLVILAEATGGNWSAFETAVLVARQNGKGEILLVLELAGLFLLGEMLLLHSAHEFKTSREAYLRIRAVIEGAPHLSKRVKQFRQSNEDTSIELMTGARLRFMARSRQSGRGFSAQRLLVDEAQILSRAAMGALMPTLSAQPNPQINYFGTVPRPDDCSEHLTDLRDRGRGGDDAFLAWLEWNIGEVCDDLDDREAWAAANPALGYRVAESFIEKERASLASDDFGRERLTIWPSDADAQPWGVIPQAVWTSAGSDAASLTDPVTFALEVTSDLNRAWIAAAGASGDVEAVELVDELGDSERVVARLVELHERHGSRGVVIDERSPAAVFSADLEAAGVPVTVPKTADVSVAALAITLGVAEGKVLHPTGTELAPVLDAAVGAAVKRSTRETWWIDRRTNAGPFIAASLALWGHRQPVNTVESDVW